jgi:hypothetical protein
MEEQKTAKPKARRTLKIFLPLGILILIIAVIALFVKSMNGPAQGSIAYTPPAQTAIKRTSSNPKKIDGKYISFAYPEHYKVVPSQQSSGYLEIVSLDNTDHSGKYISVGVLKEALVNDTGINYRKTHPDLYKQISAGSDKVVYQGKSAAAEQTGFFAHGNYVATVSLSANGSRDLSADFDTIANSLSWKQ